MHDLAYMVRRSIVAFDHDDSAGPFRAIAVGRPRPGVVRVESRSHGVEYDITGNRIRKVNQGSASFAKPDPQS